MSVKDSLLKLLEQHKGSAISGEKIAESLGVSRAAVWKAVKNLREDGYSIEARTNSGYVLSEQSDVLTAQSIEPFYSGQIHVFDEIESTNTYAKKLAADGAPHGALVVAGRQTGGRGRQGRSFHSPDGGVYMSVVLRPDTDFTNGVLITTAAAVAVCKAIENLMIESRPQIKWVNDVFLNNKKICGILTEAVLDMEAGTIGSVVVGVGVNLKSAENEFPEELKDIVTTLESAGGNDIPRGRLAAEIANELVEICAEMESGEYLEEYRKYCLVLGKKITFVENNVWREAVAETVDDKGGLVVVLTNGERETLRSGEVRLKEIEGVGLLRKQ